MSFKAGSKVVLKANATDMELGYDFDKAEAGKIYEVIIKKGEIALLKTGEGIFDCISIEAKALTWAA
jgi:hypothetical protein